MGRGKTVVDLGSGLLSLVASKHNAKQVIGFVDDSGIDSAEEAAVANECDVRIISKENASPVDADVLLLELPRAFLSPLPMLRRLREGAGLVLPSHLTLHVAAADCGVPELDLDALRSQRGFLQKPQVMSCAPIVSSSATIAELDLRSCD